MTAASLFNQLKAGRITKEQFLYEVRRDQNLPFISPITTFKESIKILQNRGIVTEVFEMGSMEEDNDTLTKGAYRTDKEGSDVLGEGPAKCQCGGTYEPHEDAGEMVCADCGEREPMAEDVHSAEDVTSKLAQDAMENNMNEDEDEYDPFYDREEEINYGVEDDEKPITGNICPHCGQVPCECGDEEDSMVALAKLDIDADQAKYNQYQENEAPSLREQVQDFVKKACEGGSTMDEAKKQAREYFSKTPAALNEAKVQLNADQVNPYELRKGIQMEMGYAEKAAPSHAEASLMNIAGEYAKAQATALKNLAKDPAYYTNKIANKKVEKVVKTNSDGYTKGKVVEKANVTNKKQKATKVVGVKTMPDKGVTGTEKIMKEDKTAKIREYVKAQLKKEIVQVKDDMGDTVKLTADKASADKFVKSQDTSVQRKLRVTGK